MRSLIGAICLDLKERLDLLVCVRENDLISRVQALVVFTNG